MQMLGLSNAFLNVFQFGATTSAASFLRLRCGDFGIGLLVAPPAPGSSSLSSISSSPATATNNNNNDERTNTNAKNRNEHEHTNQLLLPLCSRTLIVRDLEDDSSRAVVETLLPVPFLATQTTPSVDGSYGETNNRESESRVEQSGALS